MVFEAVKIGVADDEAREYEKEIHEQVGIQSKV